jgi:DNA-directed RNA polymerase
MTSTTARNAFRSPLVLPTPYPPKPWTGFREGGLPATQGWAKPELIITHGKKEIEVAVRKAIKDGRMGPFLRAINYLQNVAFTINGPVLKWVERYGLTMPGFTDVASFGMPPPTKKGKNARSGGPAASRTSKSGGKKHSSPP